MAVALSVYVWQPIEEDALVIFVKMKKLEKRAIIKYFYLKGLTSLEIKQEMDSTLRLFSIIFNDKTVGF